MEPRRLTEPMLECYLVGSLDEEARARVQAVLADSEADRARLEELRAESAAFLRQNPPGPLVERFEASRRKGWRHPLVLLVPLLASLVLLVLVLMDDRAETEARAQQQLADANEAATRAQHEWAVLPRHASDGDGDRDGTKDSLDSCPAESGPLKRKGCPEEDADKDGVPNLVDVCPQQPGVETNLGCPEHEVPLVAISPRAIDLHSKVYFEALQARIQQRSFAVLDWVARVMREHPEILRVEVGAHTDDKGLADQLRLLSQQRAEEVRRYLIDKGVAAERLVARGYGPDRPIDSNAVSIGREHNRRVDFKIIRDSNDSSSHSPPRAPSRP
ncbi:OmpA family protein [Archangium violaceum]|uniref:OmpA family protein n=1 Tax=Archangium violaceum TaxID=83451 RepID=UPI0036DF8AF4